MVSYRLATAINLHLQIGDNKTSCGLVVDPFAIFCRNRCLFTHIFLTDLSSAVLHMSVLLFQSSTVDRNGNN